MSRMMPMDSIEMLFFLKRSMEALQASYNRPKEVSLRNEGGKLRVFVSGHEIIVVEKCPFDRHSWKVNVDLTSFKGRFILTPTSPHRITVGDVITGRQRLIKQHSGENHATQQPEERIQA